jgi:hypothetical protein
MAAFNMKSNFPSHKNRPQNPINRVTSKNTLNWITPSFGSIILSVILEEVGLGKMGVVFLLRGCLNPLGLLKTSLWRIFFYKLIYKKIGGHVWL